MYKLDPFRSKSRSPFNSKHVVIWFKCVTTLDLGFPFVTSYFSGKILILETILTGRLTTKSKSVEVEENTEEEIAAKNQNDVTLPDEMTNETTQRWCPKQKQYTEKTQNEDNECIMKILQCSREKIPPIRSLKPHLRTQIKSPEGTKLLHTAI